MVDEFGLLAVDKPVLVSALRLQGRHPKDYSTNQVFYVFVLQVKNRDALVSYFTQMGVLKLLRKQPKYFGTESKEVKNRHTVYVDEHVSKESLRLLNIWVRRHGRNEKSIRLLKDWLKVGMVNTDFASASRVALLGCGNFDPETIKKKVEKPRGKRRQELAFINGEWKYIYV